MDGGPEGEISYENFNASAAKVDFKGINVHPGSAKDIMVNASKLAMEYQSLLPADMVPEKTEGREGFIHLIGMKGEVESAELQYIIRDHDSDKWREKEDILRSAAAQMQEKYGEEAVKVTIVESYRNMLDVLKFHGDLIQRLEEATRRAGLEPFPVAIRGGTDGARLTFMGLPCPNIGTGGYGFHSRMEHTTVEGMDAVTRVILEIINMYARIEDSFVIYEKNGPLVTKRYDTLDNIT